ncbi:DEP domain-containing protein 7-like isoform X2 [Tubulanus polymorphus]|uniref:DEP domain-containing protein 7-like isoform X2 n=1 Tax=Tubulanus polymorphus TaxID=672921 RepID=UPI003DA344F3
MMMTTPQIQPKFGKKFTTPQTPLEVHGQFRATQLWNNVIINLRQNVGLKRRRVKMKYYDNCFVGNEAVETVLKCLHDENNHNYIQKDVSREKAVKLCQALMDNNIFEPVKCDDSKKPIFDDSSSKYYRFIDMMDNDDGDDDDDVDCEDDDDDEEEANDCRSRGFCEYNEPDHCLSSQFNDSNVILDQFRLNTEGEPDVLYSESIFTNPLVIPKNKTQREIVQEILALSGSKLYKSRTSELRRGNISPRNLFRRKSVPNVNDVNSCLTSRDLFGRVAQEILREVALSRLLTLVDLPVLDGLLGTSNKLKSQNMAGISNQGLNISRTSMLSHCDEDAWISSAMDCLEYIPKSLKIMDSYLSETCMKFKKLELFHGIAEYYWNSSNPLLPDGFTDLLVAVLNLLMQRKYETAIQALQMMMALLTISIREELKCLFSFMRAVMKDCVTIESGLSNRMKLERTFTNAVIKNKLLAHHQAAVVVMFMVDKHPDIFDIPKSIRDTALVRLHNLKTGNLQPIMEHTYCDRVTSEEFHRQTAQQTEHALKDLLNSILDDTNISLKEKKHKFKQFQKHHPTIVQKYFSDYVDGS